MGVFDRWAENVVGLVEERQLGRAWTRDLAALAASHCQSSTKWVRMTRQ